MGQTNKLIALLKKIYKKTVSFKLLDKIVKKTIEGLVETFVQLKRFYFPKKFPWDWKLDMLIENYEKNTVNYFKNNIKPGMTVADVGAHVGYYTVIFSRLVGPTGKVLAFEPDKENFSLLEKNTSRLKNVERYENAISDKNGSVDFFKVIGSTGCHSVVTPHAESEKESVQSITLDSFVEKNTIKKIDFLKIDIEGAEPLALKGMQKLIGNSENISIVSELNPDSLAQLGETPDSFFNGIAEQKLKVYKIGKNGNITEINKNDMANLEMYQAKKLYTNILLKK